MNRWDDLLEINRNHNGDYYFIYSVPNVVNHIRPGSKCRNVIIIVGVPKGKLKDYLNGSECDIDVFKK